jgi:methionyl-tRNA synthetase
LKNVGNFSNRVLAFTKSSFNGVVPAYEGALHADDKAFFNEISAKFDEFTASMELIKLKDSLKIVMSVSSLCNAFLQKQAPWDLVKTDKPRCAQVVNFAIQVLFMLASMFEPFMPSFSAKVYQQMLVTRTPEHEVLY